MKEWGEHEAIVEKLVQECPSFTSILKVKDLSGRSGAQTFLVQPQSVDGTPLAAILKIGPAAIIKKDRLSAGIRPKRLNIDVWRFVVSGSCGLALTMRQSGVSE